MSTLEQAICLSMEEWVAALPADIPAYQHSKGYEKAIRRLFDKTRNNRYHRLTKRGFRALLIAAILLVIAIATTAVALPKSNIILTFYEGNAYITNTNKTAYSQIEQLQIKYIPDNFVLSEEDCANSYQCYQYTDNTNNQLYFSVSKLPSNTKCHFDTSGTYERITVNNVNYIFADNDKKRLILWYTDTNFYMCEGNISRDELLTIAQNMY